MASNGDAHGLTGHQIEAMRDRFESMMPQLSSSYGQVQDVLGDILPKGASLGSGAGDGYRQAVRRHANSAMPTGSALAGAGVFQSAQRPYQPEYESPDRQQYPQHRVLANRYWRLYYKLDPVIGNAIDLYADLPWSDFTLTGDGVEGEIKDTMEFMCEEAQLRSVLPFLVREFLVVGEAGVHCYFDDDRGIWTYIALHNPDQLEVVDTPFIKMEPVVEFVPDHRLREVMMSDSPMLRKVRESMPPELLSKILAAENIALSPVNFTFLPRKLHPYDSRGTSIISRMWRILMYEDAIFNASIATARRHAGPIKVAKLGNPQNGWIPGPEQEKRLLQLLAQAELDVNAWLVYHYALNFELVGTTERVMVIDKHWDLIERVKLIALGISKSFIHGEVTYASAATGLTVFLKRLKALRQFFEDKWLYPKFFQTTAEINKWVKPTEAELSHRVRIRRSQKEVDEDRRWIVPKIEWEHSLDPTVDSEVINAIQALEGIGVQFSKSTKASLAGRDYEEEAKQRVKDYELERRIFKDYPELMTPVGADPSGGGGGMMSGPPPAPPIEGDAFGDTLAPSDMNPGGAPTGELPDAAPAEVAVRGGDDDARGPPRPRDDADLYDEDGRFGIWHKTEVRDLIELFEGLEPEEEPWVDAYADPAVAAAAASDDASMLWHEIEQWLIASDFPTSAITDLEDLLQTKGVIETPEAVHARAAARRPKTRIRRRPLSARERQAIKMIKEPAGTGWLKGSG